MPMDYGKNVVEEREVYGMHNEILDRMAVAQPESTLPARFYQTIEQVKALLLAEDIPGLTALALFGSAAREGAIRSSSDVDIAVITEAKLTDRVLLAKLRDMVEDLPCEVDLAFLSLPALETVEDTFLKNFVRDAKLLWRKCDG